MIRYVLKRIILIFFTIAVILSLTFVLLKKIPSYPSLEMLQTDKALYDIMQKKYGYDKPIFTQYLIWVEGIITDWDWGVSTNLRPRVNSFTILAEKLPTTMKLNFISFLIAIPVGILLGIIAALKKNKPTDHIIMIFVMVFISIPSFVVATLLMLNADKFGLPTQFSDARYLSWKDYVIPVIALSFGPIAGFCRTTRAELTEVLTSDFILLARTKGLNRFQSTIRHALRNSMVPIFPGIIGEFVGVLSGSLVLENIYGIPGVGKIFIDSITNKDYNVTMTTLAFYTIISLFTILVGDLSYGIVDPRIRMGAGK